MQTAHRLIDLFCTDADRTGGLGRAAANALRAFDALRARPVPTLENIGDRAGVAFPAAARAAEALERLASATIPGERVGRLPTRPSGDSPRGGRGEHEMQISNKNYQISGDICYETKKPYKN